MQTPCASQRCWIRAKWFRDKRTRHTVAERKFVRCSDSLECFYLLSASSHPLYLQNYTKYLSANTLAHNTLKWAKVALKLKNNIHTSRSAPPSATKSNSDKREWSFLCAHKKQEKNAIEKLFSLEVCVGCLVLNIVAIAAQRLTEKRLFHPEIMAFSFHWRSSAIFRIPPMHSLLSFFISPASTHEGAHIIRFYV